MKPLKLSLISEVSGGRLLKPEHGKIEITGVTTDSRADAAGKLFVPIAGERANGHDFIEEIFAKGAAASFCDEKRDFGDRPVVFVDDAVTALKLLARYYRSLFSPVVVGITGSVGKTTVKDLVASVLSQKFSVMKTKGNYNTGIGLPLTMFELEKKHEFVVIEMGMRNFGEIRELADIAKPSVGIITNIGVSHIENLGSREGILRAKLELIEALDENGRIILNADDDLLAALKDVYKDIVYFGTNSDNNFWYEDVEYNGVKGVTFTLHKKGDSIRVFAPVPGRHMVVNSLCAAAVGDMFGLTLAEIKKGIESFKPSNMRMVAHENSDGSVVIDDGYNASPASMQAACEALGFAEGRKICVLGDMFELGAESDRLHIELGEYLADKDFDYLLVYGDKMSLAAEKCRELVAQNGGKTRVALFKSKDELAKEARRLLGPGAAALVKASRGLAFEDIVKELKY